VSAVPIVALVGVTAAGKTKLGERLASAIGGEIVCADSRQVFRDLELGTGKPSPRERAARPHHLFDALGLDEAASAGWYARACREVCEAIRARGRVPILVGGSGLYLRAAMHGLASEPDTNPAIRERLRAELQANGPEALHARLAVCDPPTAARLAPRDRQRIVRALEVLESSGRPLSWWHAQQERGKDTSGWRVFEVTVEPALLRERIAARAREMFANGLVEETRALVERGLETPLRALRAIGYDEALMVIDGRLDEAAAIARTSLRTGQLAKRQRTWFRHQLDAARLSGEDPGSLVETVHAALAGSD
jgi:tRNA dimethylallyltransferase